MQKLIELIARLEELNEKATEGIWSFDVTDRIAAEMDVTPVGDIILEDIPAKTEDCRLITETRNALPQILEYMKTLVDVAICAEDIVDHVAQMEGDELVEALRQALDQLQRGDNDGK